MSSDSWLRHLPEVFAFRAAALHAHTSSPSDIHGLQRTSTLPPSAVGIRIPSCRSACSYLQPVRYPWASAYRYASAHGCRPGLWITRKVSWLCHLPEVFAFRAAALHAHTSSPSDIHGLQRTSTLLQGMIILYIYMRWPGKESVSGAAENEDNSRRRPVGPGFARGYNTFRGEYK